MRIHATRGDYQASPAATPQDSAADTRCQRPSRLRRSQPHGAAPAFHAHPSPASHARLSPACRRRSLLALDAFQALLSSRAPSMLAAMPMTSLQVPLPPVAALLPSPDALCPGHVIPVCRPPFQPAKVPSRPRAPAPAVLWSHRVPPPPIPIDLSPFGPIERALCPVATSPGHPHPSTACSCLASLSRPRLPTPSPPPSQA